MLMVDDEPFSAQPVMDLLKRSGAEVTYAFSLENALDCLSSNSSYDFAIIDLRFNNGLPAELEQYAEDTDDYISFGAALASWLDDKLSEHPMPYIFYTVFPKKVPKGSIAADKLSPITDVAAQLEAFIEDRVRNQDGAGQ